MNSIATAIQKLQKYADRFWYPPLIGLLSALDNIILVIPNDGILISSSMLVPKRWLSLAIHVALGSTLGAMALAALVEIQGLPWILEIYPSISESRVWTLSNTFFNQYGLLVVFLVAVTPIMQQPVIIFASLANTPLLDLAVVVFTGRLIKFLIMAYVGSHAPRYLKKMWGLKSELEEVGVKTKSLD